MKDLKAKQAEYDKALIIAKNTCTPGDAAPEPVNAQDQLAKSNNAKAVADIGEWDKLRE